MREIWFTIRNWIDARIVLAADPDNSQTAFVAATPRHVENYFATNDGADVLTTYHRCRAILVGRKLLRRERSDKGLPRGVYRLAPLGKATADAIASQDRATAVNGGETA